MTVTITMLPTDWLQFITSEYVDGFVRDGGSAVKFIVPMNPMDDASGIAAGALSRRSEENGYVVAHVDARQTRVHLMHELFFRIAQQVPWQKVADRVIIRLARERGYREPPAGSAPVYQRIVDANNLDPNVFALDLRPLIAESVFHERTLARDFRVAMSQLCLSSLRAGEEQRRATITAWLTGDIKTVSPVRDYQIRSPINRTNARYHFRSMLRFLRYVGFPGLLVTIDAARVTESKNPRDDLLFYSRAALLDFYESLRQLIDETDRLEGCLIVVLPSNDFLEDDPKQRGMGAYQALKFRIIDEVHDARYVNPMASLIRLSMQSDRAPIPRSRSAV